MEIRYWCEKNDIKSTELKGNKLLFGDEKA